MRKFYCYNCGKEMGDCKHQECKEYEKGNLACESNGHCDLCYDCVEEPPDVRIPIMPPKEPPNRELLEKIKAKYLENYKNVECGATSLEECKKLKAQVKELCEEAKYDSDILYCYEQDEFEEEGCDQVACLDVEAEILETLVLRMLGMKDGVALLEEWESEEIRHDEF